MKFSRVFVGWTILAVVLAVPCVWAVIKVDLPVSKRFSISKTVIVGKITAVNPDNGLVEVTTVERLKDDASPAAFRIQIVRPVELRKSVKVGQPVIVMTRKEASIHMGDTWLTADAVAGANPPLWKTTGADTAAAGKTFPGTTESLVHVLEELKAGKPTLVDEFSGKVFAGGVKELGKLDVAKPTFLLTADINGDGKPDLIVGTSAGVRLFVASANGYADETEKWGLKGTTASCASAGDITGSGKVDLLLDSVVYLNDGQKFSPAPQVVALSSRDQAQVLASALIDTTGSGKCDAAVMLRDGTLLVFKNAGQPGRPWLDSTMRKLDLTAPIFAVFGGFAPGGKPAVALASEKSFAIVSLAPDAPVADFPRLTGDLLERIRGFSSGIKSPAVTLLDINADHRPDLLITGDGAAMVLMNRGFGTFLPDADAGAELNKALEKVLPSGAGSAPARAVIKNASGGHDLLLLCDDGRLLQVAN